MKFRNSCYVPKFFTAGKLYVIIKSIYLLMCVCKCFVVLYTIPSNGVHKMSLYFVINNVIFCLYKD